MEDFSKHEIYISEYITGNRFIDACEKNRVPFCKTDFLTDFKGTEQKVFVTHNSDYPINEERFRHGPKKFKHWLALNKEYDNDSITAIPVGLESMFLRVNNTSRLGRYSSPGWPNAIDKANYMDKIAKQKLDHDKLIYLNFNPATYPIEREKIIQLYKDKPWVTYQAGATWKDFYDQIATHKFVFSPRGNGVDCHRIWESLYLRTIPIVKRHSSLDDFKDLPILFVDNWDEISVDFLNKKYNEMLTRPYDLSKMKISYWEKRIGELLDE